MKEKLPITLNKQTDVVNFLIGIFSAIGQEESKINITSEGGKVFITDKEPSRITKLLADTKNLKGKVFQWLNKRTSSEPLILTSQESDLLRHCASAAYYFITEKMELSSANESFIKFYDAYFKEKNNCC